ncbi:conjugal transfer protein TraD [Mesorhizobium sp. M7A.F.Ca.US.006.01.1.1]|uniref:conjugal transfer protein TraD n=1 Tax=Mesorhizobium sp. M7A.F.Ca.US.006.01.1.1 TaxID=2496707 RepID=UPI001FDF2ADC|nr:conjugal transfer protein TraD [Mesorhizobium sp. M7A.F.Ca.US.006.01.1.1]
MRTWQVERRKRTRHLIELGGLLVKSGIVELTNDDRAIIYGAMHWIAAKLQSEECEQALWTAEGRQAFDAERHEAQSRHKMEGRPLLEISAICLRSPL